LGNGCKNRVFAERVIKGLHRDFDPWVVTPPSPPKLPK
jgi:hypothetical protein